jgi:hypothetical protein
MEYGDLIHEMVLEHLRRKLSRDYKEIGMNKKGERIADYKGLYPDMILGNHGMVLAILKVETADSRSEKKPEEWKASF